MIKKAKQYAVTALFISIAIFNVGIDAKEKNIVKASLLSEVKTIQPGESFWIGVHFKIPTHWHMYWTNPGDIGLPPTIEWKLPKGFSIENVLFPYPEKSIDEEVLSFGYINELTLLAKVTPAANLSEEEVIINAEPVEWLVCYELCIPESTTLAITLPVKNQVPKLNDQVNAHFNSVRRKIPTETSGWDVNVGKTKDQTKLVFRLYPPSEVQEVSNAEFFPNRMMGLDHKVEEKLIWEKDHYELSYTFLEEDDVDDELESEQRPVTGVQGIIVLSFKETSRLPVSFIVQEEYSFGPEEGAIEKMANYYYIVHLIFS